VKVQTSPYERAVNSLAKTDPKLADELEKACYRSMAKDREASAQLATAIKERDEALRWQHSAAFLSMREALEVIADNGTAYPADVARAALSHGKEKP
jgi:hypothetical protein